MPHPIILYDGVCGLCNRLNQFILRRDPDAIFRFASLQSPFAERILSRHGANPQDLDTVYVVVNLDLTNHDLAKEAQPDERLLPRSDAIIFVPIASSAASKPACSLVPRIASDSSISSTPPSFKRAYGARLCYGAGTHP